MNELKDFDLKKLLELEMIKNHHMVLIAGLIVSLVLNMPIQYILFNLQIDHIWYINYPLSAITGVIGMLATIKFCEKYFINRIMRERASLK